MGDISKTLPLARSSVQSAHELIKPHIHRTPVLTCKTLNDLASTPQTPESLIGTPFEGQTPARPRINFFFKCENYQRIGAFKSRGAFHALARLGDEEVKNGVVTHSSGNHAQALALAARTRGIPAYIVMPTISTPSKIAATKGYGAEVIFSGSTSEEREAVVEEVIERTGAVLVPPYDHPNIILGQGTMALEMEEQVREMVRGESGLSVHGGGDEGGGVDGARNGEIGNGDSNSTTNAHHTHTPGRLDAVIAPCGGGGMLSGIATALHGTGTLVFGAEPAFQGADDCRRSLANLASSTSTSTSSSPQRITSVKTLTIADGLRTPVGGIPWSVISSGYGPNSNSNTNSSPDSKPPKKVHGVYSVTETQILAAMRLVLERMKVVVEPSAVVGLAVALFDEGFRGVVEREGKGGVEREGKGVVQREGKVDDGWDLGVVLSGGNTSVEALASLFGGAGRGTGEGVGKGKGMGMEKEERVEGKVGLDGGREVENVAG